MTRACPTSHARTASSVFSALLAAALLLLLLVTPFRTSAAGTATETSVRSGDGTDVPYTRYVATHATPRPALLIWVPSESGPQPREQAAAQALADAGIETWLSDPLSGRFLPLAESSMTRIPGADISALITAAAATGKRVYLASAGRGAIPTLRGARDWQRAHPRATVLAGLILLSPKFFVETPDPGKAAELMPIVSATNLPVYLLQPSLSPWRWKLDTTLPALRKGGSDVFLHLLPNVRDRFYYRPDATSAENALAGQLPQLLGRGLHLLAQLPQKARPAAALAAAEPRLPAGKKARTLKPYQGNAVAPALRLPDLDGRLRDLHDERGKVVLVNFWASWCPPCVHEMPSMERLSQKLAGQPFSILAVNMAEDHSSIETFLHTKVTVSFPILLDRDGRALKRWGVFAFPTSYVIDKQGRIRYALFGAFDWDGPEVIAKLQALMAEPNL